MKIALDATYSLGENLSGVGVYSREMLAGLAAGTGLALLGRFALRARWIVAALACVFVIGGLQLIMVSFTLGLSRISSN